MLSFLVFQASLYSRLRSDCPISLKSGEAIMGSARSSSWKLPPSAKAISSSSSRNEDSSLSSHKRRLAYTHRAIRDVAWRPDDVLLVAHRGCVSRFPENSLAAIAACSEEGAHIAEIDLELTYDGHLVLMHDSSPDRTTNRAHWEEKVKSDLGKGGTSVNGTHHRDVVNLTLSELQQHFWLVQNENTGAVTNFRIPTFAQALGVARSCGIMLYVDTKGRRYVEAAVTKALRKADAFDLAMVDQFAEAKTSKRATSNISKVQFVVNIDSLGQANNSALRRSDTVAWYPFGKLQKRAKNACKLRKQTGIPSIWSVMWKNGEYYLRDPDVFRQRWAKLLLAGQPPEQPLAPDGIDTDTDSSNCRESADMEESCLGRHLYGPLAKAACARMLVTDLPSTARSALLSSGQTAPPSIYPLDDARYFSDSSYHRLAPIPACMERFLKETKQ